MHLTKRKTPFKNIQKLITQFSVNDTEIIMEGNLYFAENPKLDRYKRKGKQTDTSSHSFNDLKQNLVLLMYVHIYASNKQKQFTH